MRVLMLTWEFPPRSVGGVGRPRRRPEPGARPGRPRRRAAHAVATRERRRTAVVGGGPRAARPHRPAVAARRRARRPGRPRPTTTSCSSPTRLGDWRPDIVHAHDWQVRLGADTLADAATTRRWSPRSTRTERGQHGGRVPPGEPSTIHAVESWLAHEADEVDRQLASSWSARSIGGFELPAERIHLIPNGIDPTWWSTGESPGEPRRRSCSRGAACSTRRASRCWPGRCACCARGCPDIECVIAGRGSYLPELQSQIDLEGVSDIVHLPGFVPDDQLRDTRPPGRVRRDPVAVRAVRHRRPRGARRRRAARSSPAPAGWPS